MVIEDLHFRVAPGEQDAFSGEGDRGVDGVLADLRRIRGQAGLDSRRRPGVDRRDDLVGVDGQWKSITPEQVDEVDARMGEWARPVVFVRALRVVRPSVSGRTA